MKERENEIVKNEMKGKKKMWEIRKRNKRKSRSQREDTGKKKQKKIYKPPQKKKIQVEYQTWIKARHGKKKARKTQRKLTVKKRKKHLYYENNQRENMGYKIKIRMRCS